MTSVIASTYILSLTYSEVEFGVIRRARIVQPVFAAGKSMRCERS